MPKISVIILNYNGGSFTERCLKSLLSSRFEDYEIVLFDNDSKDGSFEEAKEKFELNRKIKFFRNKCNDGFALGNNKAVEHASGQIFFFFNNDAEIDPDCLGQLWDFFSSQPVDVAQCKIRQLKHKNKLESVGHWIDKIGLISVKGFDEEDLGQYDEVREIFGATGAAFAVRREVFHSAGGFDPDYFLMFEETDLCWRLWLAGFRIFILPQALVYHWGRGSISNINARAMYLIVRNRLVSFIKNLEWHNLAIYLPLHFLMLLGLCVLLFLRGEFRKSLNVFKGFCAVPLILKQVLVKRKMVQGTRKIQDRELFQKGLIRSVGIKEFINKCKTFDRQ